MDQKNSKYGHFLRSEHQGKNNNNNNKINNNNKQ